MRRILLFFFKLIYQPFAWAYDGIAWLVSLGQWRRWVYSVLPFIPTQGKVLEVGNGPGHLQTALAARGRDVFGLDQSAQMCRLAKRRLAARAFQPQLTRGLAGELPFATNSLTTVVSTFPAPFIFDLAVAHELHRVLKPGGKLVVLLACRPAGNHPASLFIRSLFRLTGQYPPSHFDPAPLSATFLQAGFTAECKWLHQPIGDFLLVFGNKDLEIHSNIG